jgi:hypothetical protein
MLNHFFVNILSRHHNIMGRHDRESGDRGWTDENIRIARDISNKHGALVWICNNSARRVEKRQKIIGIVIASGLYLFGTTGIPSAVTDSSSDCTNNSSNSKIALLVISVFSIILGLFQTIVVALQEDKTIGKNRWALGVHAELTKDIRKELNKDPKSRQLWRKFYASVEDKDIELQKSAPTPAKAVLKDYYNHFGNDAINERILFGGLTDIENAKRITVKRRPKSSDIGLHAEKNVERKRIMRDIIAIGDVESSIENPEEDVNPEDVTTPAPTPKKIKSEAKTESPMSERKRIVTSATRHDMRERYELERYYLTG